MELKFAPICSSRDALSIGILFCRSQNFQILTKNHGQSGVFTEIEVILSAFFSSLEGATEMKFGPFCSP